MANVLTNAPRALDIPAPAIAMAPVFTTRREVEEALAAGEISVADALDALDRIKWEQGHLVPACGGAETPFTYRGTRYLYCWHTGVKKHYYVNLDTDTVMPETWSPTPGY